MARQPEPWYWEARQAWYVQLGKRQIKLGADEKQARKEWHRVMAENGRLDERERRRMLVADACEDLCATVQTKRAATRRHYAEKLGLFAKHFGDRRLSEIQPAEVIRWIAEYQPPARDARGRKRRRWGDNSRCMQYKYVRLLMKWARDTGLIEINPFVRIDNPWRIRDRDRSMTEGEYEAVMRDPKSSPQFKEIVEFIWRAGARPGELAILTARHLDVRMRIARLQPTEHKTGERTGAQREIHFPPDLWERLKSYADHRPSGPLFRRKNGEPWTAGLITLAFGRAKRRLGLECVLYQARHAYFTNLAENGVPATRAARLGGHRKLDTFMNTYYHPETDQLQEDIQINADAEVERLARIRREADEACERADAERREKERRYNTARKRIQRARRRAEDGDQASRSSNT
jgi:integrase/recombinase XerC